MTASGSRSRMARRTANGRCSLLDDTRRTGTPAGLDLGIEEP